MIDNLKATIAENEQELMKCKTMYATNVQLLRTLLDQIHALDLDHEQKKTMTGNCQRLLDTAVLSMRLDIELTETDARFLSILENNHPNLARRELQICLLIKLDYINEEIAGMVGMTVRGLESARYQSAKKRLKKLEKKMK